MQNVLIEKPYKFVPPFHHRFLPTLVRDWGLFRGFLKKNEGVDSYEMRNANRLGDLVKEGHSVLVAPNHSRTADPLVMGFVAKEAKCLFYAMASWHLFNQGWFYRNAIRAMGAFSVNREGIDRQAIDMAVNCLQEAKRPLVIFPEGTTSRTNDRLMPILDGVAFIARTAAKKRLKRDGGKVFILPMCIKYSYEGNVVEACEPVLSEIEKRLSWRPQRDLPLLSRIRKIGEGLIALKELEHLGTVQKGELLDRREALIEHLLGPLEEKWLGSRSTDGIILRIKNLRMKLLPDLASGEVDQEERNRRWGELEETYLAQQLYCYPDNYLQEPTTVNRILETVERFEEDLTDKATVHGKLKAIIDIDEPIEVSPKRERGAKRDPLMVQLEDRLNFMIDSMVSESRTFEEG